ncbi:MAG: sulfatase-like hydrolase/transferase [Bryobacterales bacterium]
MDELPAPRRDHDRGGARGEAGYRSAAIGKWHLGQEGLVAGGSGLPGERGRQSRRFAWQHVSALLAGGEMARLGWRTFPEEREYLTDRLTREAEAFLEQSAGGPFFLYLSHYAVHADSGQAAAGGEYKAKAPSGGQSRTRSTLRWSKDWIRAWVRCSQSSTHSA